MGTIKKPELVKLFAGLIASSEEQLTGALSGLEKKFGKIDVKSPCVNFDFTDYYAAEMGGGLLRLWAGFEPLADPSALAGIKIATNEMEAEHSSEGKRSVNIDPGYITPAKVVLASSKDFSHRLYLSGGIYGEVTLMYRRNSFEALEWTYPDYKSKPALDFFTALRKIFREQLKTNI